MLLKRPYFAVIFVVNMIMKQKPLIDATYLLEKFDTEDGWTFACIPETPKNKSGRFGWVKVSGWINDYELISHTLMPMGNGTLFISIKTEIRKKIRKELGDSVRIVLYPD